MNYYDKSVAKPIKREDRLAFYLQAFRSFAITQSREYVVQEMRERAYEAGYNPGDVQELVNEAIDDVVRATQKFLAELRANAKDYATEYACKFSDVIPGRR